MNNTGLLEIFPGLEGMRADEHHRFASSLNIMSAPAGTVMFQNGSPCENYILVKEGSVRVQMVSENGREIVLYRVGGGQTCILTTSCLLSHEDYSAEGVAETDIECIVIPVKSFDELLASSNVFRSFVFASYGSRITDLMHLVDQVAFHRIDMRLAQFLIKQTQEQPIIHATHYEFATELGSSREVISRQLKEFERRGWVVLSRGQVRVINESALQSLSTNMSLK